MIAATLKNFETEVIAASLQTPVLVDFWAPWCGPCKSLSPVLEKLEAEYDGRFKLVKINSDEEQQLAAAFGIRSIPTCILIQNGQPVDGFMGAVPEGQLRQFLDKHVPSVGALQAEAGRDEADALLDAGDPDAALAHLQAALQADPTNDDARFDYARLLIATGALDDARAALAEPLAREPGVLRFQALAAWLEAIAFAQTDPHIAPRIAALDERIAQNKRDFAARHDKARLLVAAGEWPQAMDELLEIILRDKTWNDQAARKLYVALLELLTPPPEKPTAATGAATGGIQLTGKAAQAEDPRMELVSSYRRKLSMALH